MTESISTDTQYRVAAPAASADMPPTFDLGADHTVPEAAIEQFERDGVVCIRQVLDTATVDELRREADDAVANPGPQAVFVNGPDDPKTFYFEYNLWRRYPALRRVVFDGRAPDIATALMRSKSLTLYYTNTFVKDAGAADKVTPWHEDGSYFRLMGRNVVNLNLICDHMPPETTLQFKQGSHLRDEPVYVGPTFEKGLEYDEWMEHQAPMPHQHELDRRFRTLYWEVFPGDVLVWYHRTLHASPGNTLGARRHSTACVLVGDGVGYDARPGFIDTPDHDTALAHGAPPAGKVFPKIR